MKLYRKALVVIGSLVLSSVVIAHWAEVFPISNPQSVIGSQQVQPVSVDTVWYCVNSDDSVVAGPWTTSLEGEPACTEATASDGKRRYLQERVTETQRVTQTTRTNRFEVRGSTGIRLNDAEAQLMVINGGSGSGSVGGEEPGGECSDPYDWDDTLCLENIPFHTGSGAWGDQVQITAPAAPVITSTATASTRSELASAVGTSGAQITITGDWDDSSSEVVITQSDIEIIVPEGRTIGSLVMGSFGGADVNRVRVRGSTLGEHSGGIVGKIWSNTGSDIHIDGIDLNGADSIATDGQGIQTSDGDTRWAVTNTRIHAAGWCYLGSATHLVIAQTNCFHGARTRTQNGYAEGWGVRNGGGPIVIWGSRIEGTRYHNLRVQPQAATDGQDYLWVGNTYLVNAYESANGWVWANLGNGETAEGTWFVDSFIFARYSSGCTPPGNFSAPNVAYTDIATTEFYSSNPTPENIYSSNALHSTANGNTFSAYEAPPAWGGPGDPTAIPLFGGLSPSLGEGSCTGP